MKGFHLFHFKYKIGVGVRVCWLRALMMTVKCCYLISEEINHFNVQLDFFTYGMSRFWVFLDARTQGSGFLRFFSLTQTFQIRPWEKIRFGVWLQRKEFHSFLYSFIFLRNFFYSFNGVETSLLENINLLLIEIDGYCHFFVCVLAFYKYYHIVHIFALWLFIFSRWHRYEYVKRISKYWKSKIKTIFLIKYSFNYGIPSYSVL